MSIMRSIGLSAIACVLQWASPITLANGTVGVEGTTSGLQYSTERAGGGRRSVVGDTIVYSAVGSLPDGRVFLDTRAGTLRRITAGTRADDIPPGLQEVLERLHEGDRAVVIVPAALAYGEQGSSALKIPANSAVRYEIEIAEIDARQLAWVVKAAMDAGGLPRAREVFNELRSARFKDVYAAEPQLNYLGYVYMSRQNRAEEAQRVLEWNTELFPASANAWDSLGEAYLLGDHLDLALKAYRKALQLAPLSSQARKWQRLVGQLEMKPAGLPALDLMKLRMRMGRGAFADESILANLPMDVSALQRRLVEYIAHAPPIEAGDAATFVTQFFTVVERNSPESIGPAVDAFAGSEIGPVRDAAQRKRESLAKGPSS